MPIEILSQGKKNYYFEKKALYLAKKISKVLGLKNKRIVINLLPAKEFSEIYFFLRKESREVEF